MEKFVEFKREIELLNVPEKEARLQNLKILLAEEKKHPPVLPQYANNHIHTFYSFSPYSPTAAVFMARAEGLQTAGIMDHDTIGGAEEFREAGKIAGIGTTCGMECRVNLDGTRLAGRKLNNPDQAGIAYMAIHSVPSTGFARLQEVFAPYREKRDQRSRAMTERLSALVAPFGITVDFDLDVVPLSKRECGGAITERHILYALCHKIAEKAKSIPEFVEEVLQIPLSEKQKNQLSDEKNPHRMYDLLGILKAQFMGKIYLPATEECMPLAKAVALAEEVGAILCYPYLGDVTNSVTGDKKAAKFEDDFLDEVFEMLREEGVKAITYMPARNTPEQIGRLQGLCREYGMTEISGEDVNSSRQSMICPQLEKPEFAHLVEMAWKLVKREENF